MSRPYEQLSITERKSLSANAAQKSRLALQHGDRRQARRYAEQAAALDPRNEDAWLLLGALASPKASVDYLQQALKVNPTSERARKGLEWALERLKDSQKVTLDHPSAAADLIPSRQEPGPTAAQTQKRTAVSIPVAARPRRTPIPFLFYYAVAMIAVSVMLFAISLIPYYPEMAAYFSLDVFFQPQPTGAAYLPAIPASASQTPALSPPAAAASPSPTQTAMQPATATPLPTETPLPSPSPTARPSDTALPSPTATLEPTPLPSATLAPPTPVPQPAPTKKPKKKAAAASPGFRPQNVSLNDRWIDVDLSAQTAYAMQGDQVVRSFLVSTGRWPTVTVEGVFKIYVKYRTANMSGDDYFLPNVPFVMYFFKGYGIHGTYWHNNFGTPMSHGCVNLRPEDAGWLFDFASVNTIVNVHP